MGKLVETEHLSKRYGESIWALQDLSLDVDQGGWIAIMGPSGSGKTTLINILGGLDQPTSGAVRVDGVALDKLDAAGLARYRAEKIGFIFQQFHLVPYLTALENVMLAQYFHSLTDQEEAREALIRVGLRDRLDHRPSQLSGGEQQRVCIARALINHPKLILADEPTGNLDEVNEAIVINLLNNLHAEGHTILLVTHDPTIGRLADRRVELQHGRLAEITIYQQDEQERYDHLLERIWIFREEDERPEIERVRARSLPAKNSFPSIATASLARLADPLVVSAAESPRTFERMAEIGLLTIQGSELRLTGKGEQRARDVVRRHRLAERLFMDSFGIGDREAESQACKFEHILSSEVTEKICTFLGHPRSCPHGNPIPPGNCCQLGN